MYSVLINVSEGTGTSSHCCSRPRYTFIGPDDFIVGLSEAAIPQRLTELAKRILSRDVLCDTIFDACSAATIIRVSLTCRTAYDAVQSYFLRACDMNKLLSRYFPDPLAFRALQRRTGMLVAGSTALQFFLRERYPESDLDMYVREGAHEEVMRWIVAQGYTYQPDSSQNADFETALANQAKEKLENRQPYHSTGISSIFTFVKPLGHHPDGMRELDVVVATNTAIEPILRCYSSALMNIVAWDYAYALYPRATVENRKAVHLQKHTLQLTQTAVEKYAARGLKTCFDLTSSSRSKLFNNFVQRWVGDRRTWTLRLPTDGVAPAAHGDQLSRDPCVCTSWRLQGRADPKVQTFVVKGPHMRLSYLDSHDGRVAGMMEEVKRRCGRENGDDDNLERCLDEDLIQCYIKRLVQNT